MTIQDLGKILSNMYENAEDGEKVTMIHLFGIKYSNYIRSNGYSLNDIITSTKLSNGDQMHASYLTEINKGIKLAKYVDPKKL